MSPLHGFVDALRKALHHDNRRSATRSHRGGKRRAAVGLERLEDRALLTARAVPGHPGGTTDTAVIEALAADAYLWGLAPEFAQRFSKYNTIVGAPFNALQYGSQPSAWNNAATNAGDASVLYINSFIDFSRTGALVLTVPLRAISTTSSPTWTATSTPSAASGRGRRRRMSRPRISSSARTRLTPSNGP
jgi:hypothetical protein